MQQARLASVTLPMAAACLGRPLADQVLPALGVQVVSLRLASGRVVAADDALVLSGLPEALALAEAQLLKG